MVNSFRLGFRMLAESSHDFVNQIEAQNLSQDLNDCLVISGDTWKELKKETDVSLLWNELQQIQIKETIGQMKYLTPEIKAQLHKKLENKYLIK